MRNTFVMKIIESLTPLTEENHSNQEKFKTILNGTMKRQNTEEQIQPYYC